MENSNSPQAIEVEAESLEEAEEQIKSQIPQGFSILSQTIISDGKPKTVKGIAETIEAACAKAQSEIPANAEILETKESITPNQKIIAVVAFDEEEAKLKAVEKAEKGAVGQGAVIKSIRLVTQGSKGFLGIGKRPNQYEAELFHPAVVEISYKWKAKICVTFEDKVKPLIAALKDSDRDVRATAAEALGKIGDARAIALLIATLKDEDIFVCRVAVGALGETGNARAIEPLITALKHEDSSVRGLAAEALGKIGDARAVEPLITALKDRDRSVLRAAARALGKINPNWAKSEAALAAVPMIIAALKDEDSKLRRATTEALCVIGDARAVEPLIAALEDEDKDVRWSAAVTLGEIGDARAVEPLIAALKDRDGFVRSIMAQVLGKIGDSRAVKPLVTALKDRDDDVRLEAAEALRKLGYTGDKKEQYGKTILYAFAAQTGQDILNLLGPSKGGVITKSLDEWKDTIRQETQCLGMEVVIVPSEKWNPPLVRSFSEQDIMMAIPEVMTQVQKAMSKMGLPYMNPQQLIEVGSVAGSPVTGKIFFVYKVKV